MGAAADYNQLVIAKGDEGSRLLRELTLPTLERNSLVDLVGSNAVLRVPEDHLVVVHSTTGREIEFDPYEHARSLPHRLFVDAQAIGAELIGFANVVNVSEVETDTLRAIARGLVDGSDHYSAAVMNGELAVLGSRVMSPANIMGTAISIVPKGRLDVSSGNVQGKYVFFDPQGRPVFINADGVGTKTELYERAGRWEGAVHDFLAMNLDDAIKMAADPQVVSGIVETKGKVPYSKIEAETIKLSEQLGIPIMLTRSDARGRIASHNLYRSAFNLDGAVVSTIDEARLENPLRSEEGNYLLAVWSNRFNVRSNGISSLRRLMVANYGDSWHMKPNLRGMLDYLTQPSTILFPAYRKLVGKSLVTNVYHMSGGAFDGKLAKPLTQQGLGIEFSEQSLPDPCYEQQKLVELAGASMQQAYGQWPMNIDGFVSVRAENLAEATTILQNHGLYTNVVGRLDQHKRGVIFRTYTGEQVEFTGCD